MNGTPQTTSQSLIDELNSLKTSDFDGLQFKLMKLHRDARNLQGVDAIASFIIQGGIASLEGKIEKMKSYHEKALRLDKNNFSALFNYATSLNFCHLHHEAIPICEKLVSLNGDNDKSYLQIIKTLAMLGMYSSASSYANEFFDKFSDSKDASLIEGIDQMSKLLNERNIPEDEVVLYSDAMNNVLKKHNVHLVTIKNWLTEENELVRDVVVDVNEDKIFELNDDLIDALSEIDFSQKTLLNFTGYFISA